MHQPAVRGRGSLKCPYPDLLALGHRKQTNKQKLVYRASRFYRKEIHPLSLEHLPNEKEAVCGHSGVGGIGECSLFCFPSTLMTQAGAQSWLSSQLVKAIPMPPGLGPHQLHSLSPGHHADHNSFSYSSGLQHTRGIPCGLSQLQL